MKIKIISLNELRLIVRKMINEEMGYDDIEDEEYFHLVEYDDYGEIEYHGYFDNLKDAKREMRRLSNYFPRAEFKIIVRDSPDEPDIRTL